MWTSDYKCLLRTLNNYSFPVVRQNSHLSFINQYDLEINKNVIQSIFIHIPPQYPRMYGKIH